GFGPDERAGRGNRPVLDRSLPERAQGRGRSGRRRAGPAAVRVRLVLHLRRDHQPQRRDHPQAEGAVHAQLHPSDADPVLLLHRLSGDRRAGGEARQADRLHAGRRGGARHHAARLPAVHSRLADRDLRLVPLRAVRAGERGSHRPGGRQPADLASRAAAHRTQPPDLRPSVQFVGHHRVSHRRLHPDPRQPRRRHRRRAHRPGAGRLSHRREPGDRQRLPRPRRRLSGGRDRRVAVPRPAPGQGASRAEFGPRRLRPARPRPLRPGRAVHLPLRRRGGLHRVADRQLPPAAGRARARRAVGWQAHRALLGRRDGRPLHRFGGAPGGEPWQGAGLRRRRRRRADPALGGHDRNGFRLQPAGGGADELHHVPDHLQPGLRRARQPRGRRVGDHQRRHLRRRGGAARHRRAGGRDGQLGDGHAAARALLLGDPGLRRLRAPAARAV
ncbi:MAG: Homolog of fucose/glucose/galactose permeases, partial [uncultured Sphingomonadaceae bacterium]